MLYLDCIFTLFLIFLKLHCVDSVLENVPFSLFCGISLTHFFDSLLQLINHELSLTNLIIFRLQLIDMTLTLLSYSLLNSQNLFIKFAFLIGILVTDLSIFLPQFCDRFFELLGIVFTLFQLLIELLTLPLMLSPKSLHFMSKIKC